MFRPFKSILTRLVGLTITPPIITSVKARSPNRFRPILETFEDRTVPGAQGNAARPGSHRHRA